MNDQLAVSIKYESRSIYRNVRPIGDILQEFEAKEIAHTQIDPEILKYGTWNIVVAFSKPENYELFKEGKITIEKDWLQSGSKGAEQSVNPLKASKRAAGGG